MINYQEVLKKILLKDEEKFFHGLSCVINSLIAYMLFFTLIFINLRVIGLI